MIEKLLKLLENATFLTMSALCRRIFYSAYQPNVLLYRQKITTHDLLFKKKDALLSSVTDSIIIIMIS